MQCSEVLDLLSAFHDGELPPDRALSVEAHLTRCDSCRRELASFQRLSETALQLRTEERPKSMWRDIESLLADRAVAESGAQTQSPRRLARRTLLVVVTSAAALCVLAAWWVWPRHDHLAADFDEFLQLLDEDVDVAQSVLVSNYSGRPSTIEEATEVLKYTPVVARGMPGDFTLDAAYLLKMPCCTCLEAVFRRDEGGYLCVFEHEVDQPVWFGEHPSIAAECHGKMTRVVQVDGKLAATWPIGKRHLTIIGALSIDEVSELVEALRSSDHG